MTAKQVLFQEQPESLEAAFKARYTHNSKNGFFWVVDLNLIPKADLRPVGQDPLSAFNSHNLALSRSLHRPHFQSSPHTFSLFLASSPSPSCLHENISSSIIFTTVSNEPYPPPHFRLPAHMPISLSQYCLWGHWVWEEERGCRGGVFIAVRLLGVQSARYSI